MKNEYKETIKELNTNYKEQKQDYNMLNRINGTTSTNDSVQKYEELKAKQLQKRSEKEAKAKARAEAKEQKRLEKERKKSNSDNI